MHARLRAATADAHAALDARLRGALVSRERYGAFLRASHRALEMLEAPLGRFPRLESSVGRRARLIERDLAALRESTSPSPPGRSSVTLELSSEGEAFGAAYVVEGSALGGLALAKGLGTALGLDDATTRYLRDEGRETLPAWRSFLARLEAWNFAAPLGAEEQAVRGARAAFALYGAAFVDEGKLETAWKSP